ncbi:MAG: hypothetical protein HRT58_00840 [Crocinitomicaceae bacterium]|nr:hypothetical protein [Flavobacteriales bacterium]NQZ34169.1 hypothetical protein [Crocinitomicaceae bacterium]
MLKLLFKNWTFIWTLCIVASSLLSFAGGYGYFYVLALFYPLAQVIAMSFKPRSKYYGIWMLHFVYWLFILYLDLELTGNLLAFIASSILGEVLLRFIFKDIIKYRWLLFNSLAMIVLILLGTFLMHYKITNDMIQIALMVLLISVPSIISAQGIKLKK